MKLTKKQSIFLILFGNNDTEDINEYEIKDPELRKAQAEADILGREVEMSINTETKPSKNGGGFTKRVDTPGIKQETLNKMRETLKEDRGER